MQDQSFNSKHNRSASIGECADNIKYAYRDVCMFVYGYRDAQTNMHMKIYRQTQMELKTEAT